MAAMIIRRGWVSRTALCVSLMLGVAVVLALAASDEAEAAVGDVGFAGHPGPVPEVPERGYPVILKTPELVEVNPNCPEGCLAPRATQVVDMIGPYIVSGGTFQSIRLQNGTTISQPHLAIFDSRDKSLACANLDVDDEVLAIAPGPKPNTAVIGGRFDKITGPDGVQRTRNKVALINLDTCAIDKSWIVSGLNGRVTELAVTGNRLFIAGDFTRVGGTTIDRIAEVSLDGAALNRSFDPNFGGALGRAVVGMEASRDGTRLAIVHRATSVMGQSIRGTAIFNISNPANITLTNHQVPSNLGLGIFDEYYGDIQDGAITPDFSTIIVAFGTETASDYVVAVPTVEAPTDINWAQYMRDSSFGVAATNDVVYVAGHFCKIDEGPRATEILAPNSGPRSCTGSTFVGFEGGAWRTQLAALDLTDGTPLAWNPGNNAFVGGRAVTVVDRGLLVGFDGDRTNDRLTGTTAFFDFGAPAEPPPPELICSAVVDGSSVVLSWNAIDGVSNYVVRRNGKWLASAGNVTSFTDSPPAGQQAYAIRMTVNGQKQDTPCSPTVTVAAVGQTCSAVLNGDGSISLSWSAIPGENFYTVRRNGKYLAGAGNVLSFVDDPGAGSYEYVIRSKRAGVVTDTPCSPMITVNGGGAQQECSVTNNGNGSLRLDWSALPGSNTYVVRRNSRWLATVTEGRLSYEVADHSAGDSYTIRARRDGRTIDIPCG